MTYIELALDELSHRGHAVPLSSVRSPAFVRAHHGRPAWRSYFCFDEELVAFLAGHRALSTAFTGSYSVDRIRMDYESPLDDGRELERVLDHVREVVRQMTRNMDVDESWVQPWFSGRRGFHIELPDLFGLEPGPSVPAMLRDSLGALFGSPFLDLKPVGPAGLIRLEWSKHQKGELYKVPLTLAELYGSSPDEIRHLASDPPVTRKGFVLAQPEDVEPIWRGQVVRATRTISFGAPKEGQPLQYDPTRVVTCMQKLAARGAEPGRRHKDLLRLVSWARKGGVPLEWTVQNVMSWLGPVTKKQAEDFEYQIRHAYEKGYLYGCQDPVMSEFCDPKCIFYKDKNYATMLSNADTMGKGFKDFLRKVHEQGLGFDLAQFYPQMMRGREYRIVPGEVLMLTGDTGLLKTALVQNWIVDLGHPTVWLNLEMAEHLMFRRFLQVSSRLPKFEIERIYARGREEETMPLEESISHIQMMSIAPTIQMIEQVITQREPAIMVVDTTDAIEVPEAGSNVLFKLRRVMESMRTLAQRHQIIIICIHHISKSGSRATGGDDRFKRSMSLNDLSGDRSNVTKVDHVFVIEGMRESNHRVLRSLKTRDGGPIQIPLVVDFSTFRFGEPDLDHNPLMP